MSLSVEIYVPDESGQRQWVRGIDYKAEMESWRTQNLTPEEMNLEITRLHREHESWRTLAGPEVWRTEMYGSQVARSLGLTLLPSLSEKNIDVEGQELDRLAYEIEQLIQNIPRLVPERPDQWESVLLDFQNIANAAAEAKELNGGVVIW